MGAKHYNLLAGTLIYYEVMSLQHHALDDVMRRRNLEIHGSGGSIQSKEVNISKEDYHHSFGWILFDFVHATMSNCQVFINLYTENRIPLIATLFLLQNINLSFITWNLAFRHNLPRPPSCRQTPKQFGICGQQPSFHQVQPRRSLTMKIFKVGDRGLSAPRVRSK
ncbi:hypothetical protein CEXT_437691 [Caerostris extrusa]|uniref:Uncharacterized protein n=1 Tax=Caerostris extrusa TaxID=172846 RepID=A0AAV4XM31_CAEEX|nr:hypothetical protein CEXT_437691 [Caerostris extrusa]